MKYTRTIKPLLLCLLSLTMFITHAMQQSTNTTVMAVIAVCVSGYCAYNSIQHSLEQHNASIENLEERSSRLEERYERVLHEIDIERKRLDQTRGWALQDRKTINEERILTIEQDLQNLEKLYACNISSQTSFYSLDSTSGE